MEFFRENKNYRKLFCCHTFPLLKCPRGNEIVMTPPKFISIVVEGWYLRHNFLICRKWNGNRPQDYVVYYMLFGKSRFTIIFMSTLVLNISLPKRTSIYSFTIRTKTMKSYIEFSILCTISTVENTHIKEIRGFQTTDDRIYYWMNYATLSCF